MDIQRLSLLLTPSRHTMVVGQHGTGKNVEADWYEVRLRVHVDGVEHNTIELFKPDDLISNFDRYVNMMRDAMRETIIKAVEDGKSKAETGD